jgi:hypothetical protein
MLIAIEDMTFKEILGEDVYPGRSAKLLWDNNNMKLQILMRSISL